MKITEAQLRGISVRNHLKQRIRTRINEETADATDELKQIITKLGLGDVDKTKLAQAMKAGDDRSAVQK